MKTMPAFRLPARGLWACAAALALATGAHAQTVRTWDGNGGDNRWGWFDPIGFNTNWTHAWPSPPTVLSSGDILHFTGSRRTANTNDFQDIALGGIGFLAGASSFELRGRRVFISGNVVNLSAQAQVIEFEQFSALGTTTWSSQAGLMKIFNVAVAPAALTINGNVQASSIATGLFLANSTVDVTGGAQLSSPYAELGSSAAGAAEVRLDGAGSRWVNSGDLFVGSVRGGAVSVRNGAGLQARLLGVGGTGQAAGLRVSGVGSQVTVDNASVAAGAGSGQIHVESGGVLATSGILQVVGQTAQAAALPQLRLSGSAARVETGQLLMQGWALADVSGPGSRLQFNSGTLESGSSAVLRIGAGASVAGDVLSVGSGALVQLDGGALELRQLNLFGGRVAGGALPAAVQTARGHGDLDSALTGGAGRWLIAEGGTLRAGDASRSDGVDWAGRVQVQTRLELRDADAARLSGRVDMAIGSQLASTHGIVLAGELVAPESGGVPPPTRIEGPLWLEGGRVQGSMQFTGAVGGEGSIDGNSLLFNGAIAPEGSLTIGTRAQFRAFLGTGARVEIDIRGVGDADRLVSSGALAPLGNVVVPLVLSFAAGVQWQPGMQWDVLDLAALGSQFALARAVQIVGIDPALLDLSRLGSEGVVSVVPEPGSWALMLAGTAALLARRRRATHTRR